MFPRTIVFLLAVALGPFVALRTAAAQDDHLESSPLNVTTQFSFGLGTECEAGEGVVVQLHYTGTQPLRGYLVRLTLVESLIGKVPQVPQVQILQEIRHSGEPMIASGAEWTRTVCTKQKKSSGDPTTVTAKVDVLKFADGSIWGPAVLPESHQLIGALDGIDFLGKTTELKRFVSPILPQQGPLPVKNVESQTIGPLRIESGVWRDERGQELLAVEVTNESATAIRGYLFTTSFFDPTTGARLRRVSTKELETHGNPSDYLAPGSSWVADPRKFSYLPDGTLASYKITVDLVVFADGSTFGPKKSRESDEVLGMFRGIDGAKRMSQEASANKER
jgi:hypothetical protein